MSVALSLRERVCGYVVSGDFTPMSNAMNAVSLCLRVWGRGREGEGSPACDVGVLCFFSSVRSVVFHSSQNQG